MTSSGSGRPERSRESRQEVEEGLAHDGVGIVQQSQAVRGAHGYALGPLTQMRTERRLPTAARTEHHEPGQRPQRLLRPAEAPRHMPPHGKVALGPAGSVVGHPSPPTDRTTPRTEHQTSYGAGSYVWMRGSEYAPCSPASCGPKAAGPSSLGARPSSATGGQGSAGTRRSGREDILGSGARGHPGEPPCARSDTRMGSGRMVTWQLGEWHEDGKYGGLERFRVKPGGDDWCVRVWRTDCRAPPGGSRPSAEPSNPAPPRMRRQNEGTSCEHYRSWWTGPSCTPR